MTGFPVSQPGIGDPPLGSRFRRRGERHLAGTQEQLAILTRFAFTELLLTKGRPATVILDDAMSFSDDDRIEHMFDILMRAGDKVQILVRTCRKRLFSRLGATADLLSVPQFGHHASVDDKYMLLALEEARKAEAAGEVPVGAVIADAEGNVVARGFNQPISTHDPTAHAEIVAMRAAARAIGNYRLTGLTLYCTMEPCVMCAGAIVHARIQRLVYGAADARAGAAGSIYDVVRDSRLNHQVEVISGIRESECREFVQAFFERRRG